MSRVVMVAVGGPRRASSRLRVHAWAPRLEAEGIEATIFAEYPDPGDLPPASALRAMIRDRAPRLAAALREGPFWRDVLARAREADAVLLQEVVPPRRVTDALARAADRLVFDFSDPIHTADGPMHGLRYRLQHRFSTEPRLKHLLRAADAVLLENDLIEPYAAQGGARVEVMRGPIDVDVYKPRRERDDVAADPEDLPVVGWTGSDRTLRFLEPLVPVLREVRAEIPFRLHTVGPTSTPELGGLDVVNTPWEMEAEARAVAGFDVALAWLPDTPWTRLRGGAKLIVYMAAGVPVVTSPGGIGDQVITPGAEGFLAATPDEWREGLRTLLTDGARREEMARTARRTAVERHGYGAYLPLLRELLGV